MSMRETLAAFFYIFPALVCAAAGSYMAINSIDGWGWLLFVAVILLPSRIRFGKAAEIDAQRELEQARAAQEGK